MEAPKAEYLLSPYHRRLRTAVAAARLLQSEHCESPPVLLRDSTIFMARPFQWLPTPRLGRLSSGHSDSSGPCGRDRRRYEPGDTQQLSRNVWRGDNHCGLRLRPSVREGRKRVAHGPLKLTFAVTLLIRYLMTIAKYLHLRLNTKDRYLDIIEVTANITPAVQRYSAR